MSWQGYIDNQLLGSHKITHAAILGLAGGIWAHSPGYDLPLEEQKAIVTGLNESNHDHVRTNGVRIKGQKYFTLSVNERSIYGKKGADGVVIVKTKQAALVCVYESPIQAAEATPVVEGLADYLISVGY